eukprot:gene4448-4873_t
MSSQAASQKSLAAAAIQNPLFQSETKKAAFQAVDKEENDNDLWNQDAKNVDPSQLDVDEKELSQIKKYSRVMRFAMIGIATLMIITAWYNIASSSSSLAKGFLAFYLFIFGFLLCCFEIAMRSAAMIIVQNFGFLYSPVGKVIFLVFISFLAYELSTLGKVCFALLLAYACMNIYIGCKHPQYGRYQRLMHYYNRARASRRSANDTPTAAAV